ncbi:unnamed protein product [Didymodactylos carnosus]|uniref:Uncharacterized protein n=1 Tax=Didymodactylos carnosus TaxID=1234261 RepID=A0A815J810_9BILA|nr:unnamed protein product [Didymodactylos carnosus]CAF4263898.1 unnamed protein product [Didymodactylos carnosus]
MITIFRSIINNQIEKAEGTDLNRDGYIGGEGTESKIENATHIDFNRDGIIGRTPDTYPGGSNPGSGGY